MSSSTGAVEEVLPKLGMSSSGDRCVGNMASEGGVGVAGAVRGCGVPSPVVILGW